METNIRPASENDLESICSIFNHAILHTTAVYHYEPYTLAMMQQWFQLKQEQNYPVIVALQNNKVAGFASYGTFRPYSAYQFTAEISVYIDPDYQKKGIAKMLYNSLIPMAKQNGIHSLIAGIDAQNEISIRLHEQYQFIQVGYIKAAGFKFERWLDLVLMQRML